MFERLNNDSDNLNIDPVPNALIIFSAGMDAIDIMTRLFPKLIESAPVISPLHNVKKCLPPTLWMCGNSDLLYEQNKHFVNLMINEGNKITFVTYEGMEHGFFHYGRHENRCFHDTILKIEEHLRALEFI